jgi:hypothetical protein
MYSGEPTLEFHNPAPNPIGYLSMAIQGVQPMPGRRAIFLFTSNPGFPAPQSLIDARIGRASPST